jgi:Family of unknown function (DUF6544)
MKLELKKEVAALFSSANRVIGNYDIEQIVHLPEPVKEYFKYALKEKQALISYARLKHGGQFKPSKSWTQIKGEEYFTVKPPGFAWFGKVRLVSAKDTYADGSGRMQIKLLSIFKLVDATGDEFNQGELVRWLSETPWFPTALLPSQNLTWEPIDASSARVFVTDHNKTVEGSFFFNDKGEITKFTAKRYGDGKLQDWICQYYDYREVEGMHIPFYAEASWNSDSEDSKYAKFRIEKIEYDAPSEFGDQ